MLDKARLFYIADARTGGNCEERTERACHDGADAVLFRPSGLTARAALSVGQELKNICRKNKALFFFDHRPDIAFALDSDGVQLDPDDVPLAVTRQIVSSRRIIGVTASSLRQAVALAQEGADYIMLGPLYHGAKGPGEESGVDLVRMVTKRVKAPVYVFGGISAAVVPEALAAGAHGFAAGDGSGAAAVREIRTAIADAFEKPPQCGA